MKWTDGSDLQGYTHWQNYEPNNACGRPPGQNCVLMWGNR
jgi:hypothetical protein